MQTTRPTCPECGSHSIREWALVPVPYDIESVDADGIPTYSECVSDPVWDGSTTDEYRCRDCDFSASRLHPFIPAKVTS